MLKSAAAAAGGSCLAQNGAAQVRPAKKNTLRDRL
jgi:hypothetical protein